jgi:hypothetical protein
MYVDLVKDEAYNKLQDVSSHIITKFKEAGFNEGIDEKLKFDEKSKKWEQHFHLTVLRAKGKDMMDAKPISQEFGDFELAKVPLESVQLSSRSEFESDGQRMRRDLFKGDNHTGTFACESKILLSLDF